MKKLIIYDLDGTLVDTGEDICRSINLMLTDFGRSPLPRKSVDRSVGRGVHYLIQKCLATEDEKIIEKGIKTYRSYYVKHMMDHSCLYPGAKEMLEFFKSRHQVVLTNKPNPFSEDMLGQLGVGHYFAEVIAGNSGVRKKPDPEAIHNWQKKWGLSPSEILMVGDSRIDIETCRNAGIECAVLSHGFSGEDELKSASPDYYAGSFPELLERAKKESW